MIRQCSEMLELQELLDLEQIEQIINQLASVSGTAVVLRDRSGAILLRTPSRRICSEFHRSHPDTLSLCEQKPELDQTDVHSYRIRTCRLGLIEASLPIVIGGVYCGSFYTGQLFFSPPDLEFFSHQAELYGFNREEYLSAVCEVPVMAREQLESFMELLKTVTHIISLQAFQQLQLRSQAERLSQLNVKLQRERGILSEVHTIADVGYILIDRESRAVKVSAGISEYLGYEPVTIDRLMGFIHPDDRNHQQELINNLLDKGIGFSDNRFQAVTPGESVLHVISAARILETEGEDRDALIILSDISIQAAYEQQLLEVNLRLEEAQQLAQIGSFVYRREADELTFSREGCRILGLIEGQWISLQECLTLVHPEDVSLINGFVDDIRSDGARRQVEIRIFQRITGSILRLRLICGANTTGKGWFTSIGTFQDITEEYRVKRELEDQHAFMKTLVETMPVGIFWMDRDLILRGCNRVFAYDADETTVEGIIGRRDRDFRNIRRDAAKYNRENRRLLSTGIPLYNHENRIVRSDGRVSYTYTNKVPIYDAHRRIVGLLGVYTDITEMKELYQQLEDRVNQLRAIVDTSSDPIIMFSLSLELELISPSIEQVLGYTFEQCLSLELSQVLTRESHEQMMQRVGELERIAREPISDPRSHSMLMELDMVHADGHRVFTEVHLTPMVDSGGTIYSILGIIRDTTRHRLMEQQLRHTQKIEAVGRLAGGIAHDFNNMLQVIMGYAEILKEHLGEELARELVEPIQEAGGRAVSLVSQLLLFGRQRESEHADLDMCAVVQGFYTMMKPLGDHVSCRITAMPDQPVCIRGDEHQLNQAMFHICINAKEAMNGEGQLLINVGVETLEDRLFARVSFTDEGAGIAYEDLEHIFEPFFSSKHSGPSSGLGLPSVYAIMEQHEGHIRMYSLPGYGARVELMLPLSGADSSTACEEGLTLLWAGSDEMLQKLCCRSLEDLGYLVRTVNSEADLLQELNRGDRRISCVITDQELLGHNFSGSSGHPDIPLICYGKEEHHMGGTFLRAPFSMVRLISSVDQVLGQESSRI